MPITWNPKSQFAPLELLHDGLNRTALLYRPTQSSLTARPLIFGLHGRTGSATAISGNMSLHLIAPECYVCYPQGWGPDLYLEYGRGTWNAGRKWKNLIDPGTGEDWVDEYNIDDLGFLSALLTMIQDDYLIDSNQIYVCGQSRGGMMAYYMALHNEESFNGRLKAICPSSATMCETVPDPPLAMPVLHIHGTDDTSVPFDGGDGHARPVPYVLARWADWNGRNTQEVEHYKSVGTANYYQYAAGEGVSNAYVRLILLNGAGHGWFRPGELGHGNLFDASREAWQFFQEVRKNQ